MAEWTDVKTEDTPTFLHSAMDGTEPRVHLTPTEPHVDSGEQSVSLPETEPVYPGRPPTATPSERQRTVQACDKCRERKTKCSGEHPVCQRCNTRGLICQYSTREPRTRGPNKARLRNAVSTTDLRSSPKPRTYSHGAHHPDRPLHQLRQHYPQDILTNQQSLRRVASTPRSFHGSDSHPVPMNTHGFEPVSETFMQPFGFDENSYDSPTFSPRQLQYVAHNPRAPQWRDVRRVQSYSTLIGSSEGHLSRYASPHPLASLGTHESYGQWTSQERISTPPAPMYNMYDQFMPPAAPLEHQMPLLSSKVHPWGYHSDGGSTGSEPISRSEPNIEYSPSSSEDVPEPSPRTTAISAYTHYDDVDMNTGLHHASQNGCTLSYGSPVFTPGEHYSTHGVMVRPASESSAHAHYLYP